MIWGSPYLWKPPFVPWLAVAVNVVLDAATHHLAKAENLPLEVDKTSQASHLWGEETVVFYMFQHVST